MVFTDNVDKQGYPTSNITNVWVYYNYNPIGVYDVPALFPILAKGKTLIQFSAGIENNGLQETCVIYPFYTYDTTTIDLQSNQTSFFVPHFTYRPNVKFPLDDSFDDYSNYFDTVGGSQTTLTTYSGSNVKYGKYCRLISLDNNHSFFQCKSTLSNGGDSLPNDGSSVYVELDYMCNIPFSIGLLDINNGTPFSPNYFEQINPLNTWNKIYIDLGPYLATTGKNSYQIAFEATLPQGVSSGQIYLDNIKVLHF